MCCNATFSHTPKLELELELEVDPKQEVKIQEAPPLGRHQGPDPRAGWRVSIRPQPTRAPRREAMALGPLWGRGAARAVARVPTRQWGVGGTTGGTAAAALRLPLPPGATGVAAGGPQPPPPPPGRVGAWGAARGRALPVRGPAATGGAPAPDTEGPLPRPADLGSQRCRDANRGPLPARGCPPAATDQSQWAHRGGGAAASQIAPVALLDTPGAGGGGNGGGSGPGSPPPGVAPVSGPLTWLEGVYTPTAHEGAPGRGDGTGSPGGGGGCSPGSGAGPHATVGGWRYNRGRSRRGTAAPPSAGHGRDGDRGTATLFGCWAPGGEGVSQGIGTQPADAVFHPRQLKNGSFRNLFF